VVAFQHAQSLDCGQNFGLIVFQRRVARFSE
jgi:hypothetical protein